MFMHDEAQEILSYYFLTVIVVLLFYDIPQL
jgi:hypothetical protein